MSESGLRYDTSPIGTGKNWVTKTDPVSGLGSFVRAVVHALIRDGHPESEAIQIALGVMKDWASGKGNVTAKTRAKAAEAVAHWEGLKAAAHGTRDFVTESSSAGDLLPVVRQPLPPVPRQALTIGPDTHHAFRGSNPAVCAVCGKPAVDAIHSKKRERTSGQRHAGPGHAPVQTGHVAGDKYRKRLAEKASFGAAADQVEPQMEAAMRKLFAQQETETVSRLTGKRGRQMMTRAQPPDEPSNQPPAVTPDASAIFDPVFWANKTAEVAQPVYDAASDIARSRVRSQLGPAVEGADETRSTGAAADILASRSNRMANDVTSTTFNQIQDQLAQGQQNGESIPQLATRVRGVFAEASKNRASLIARTEVVGALNQAADSYAKNLPPGIVGGHQWLAIQDTRTRPTHRRADGQIQPLGMPFHVGKSLMQHPGDRTAPPDETCNCRCSALYIPVPQTGTSLKEAA